MISEKKQLLKLKSNYTLSANRLNFFQETAIRWQSKKCAEQLEILSGILEWGVKQVQFAGWKKAKLLKEIQHINFHTLYVLDVVGNEIETIEGIDRIHLPVIRQILLGRNYVISIKPFRKINWPFVNKISFQDNHHIFELKPFFQAQIKNVLILTLTQNCAYEAQIKEILKTNIQDLHIYHQAYLYGKKNLPISKKKWPLLQ